MENKEWKNGLPEVGEKVECYWFNEWHLVEITGIGRSHVLFVLLKCGTEYSQFIAEAKFRSIKSKQEIGREAEIDKMIKLCPYQASKSTAIDCEVLYDAGYRNNGEEVDVFDFYRAFAPFRDLDFGVMIEEVHKRFKIYPRSK